STEALMKLTATARPTPMLVLPLPAATPRAPAKEKIDDLSLDVTVRPPTTVLVYLVLTSAASSVLLMKLRATMPAIPAVWDEAPTLRLALTMRGALSRGSVFVTDPSRPPAVWVMVEFVTLAVVSVVRSLTDTATPTPALPPNPTAPPIDQIWDW